MPAVRWSRLWPAAVPVLWCGLAVAAMRPDALAARADVPAWATALVYDESDLGALVLRGANAHAGRLPGRADEPARGATPGPELAPRYYLEYPTPALAVFRLGFALQPGAGGLTLPPAVADAHHHAVAFHVPGTDAERELWRAFRRAGIVDMVLGTAGLVGLMLVVGRGYGPGGELAGPVWLMALPGAVFFAVNRFDVLPALATALSFACLGRGRPGWAGAWLAVGGLLKVYPVLLAPVVLRYLGARRGLAWLAGFAGTLAAGAGACVALTDWDGTVGPVRVQLSRPLEPGWTLYGWVLPVPLGESATARLLALGAVVLAVVVMRPVELIGVLRRATVVLIAFSALAVFWSPQWLVWLLPILVPLVGRNRALLGAAAANDLLTYFGFPILYSVLFGAADPELGRALVGVAVWLRAGVWLAIVAILVRDEWAAR